MSATPPLETEATQDILDAFGGSVPKLPVSGLYRLGLGIVALTMVLLPLIYVALIAAAAYGIYWHVTTNQGLLAESEGWISAGLFLLPLVVGLILVVFMIKPLFAPRGKEMEPLPLTPEEEPRLHAFVERLCEVVGAPRPRRIVVDCEANASAGFRRGFLSFVSNDLVLTIGLPLAGALSLRELAGVLAHEFGHFSQQTGMRLTYLIRSVNGWFARVVYTRDAWDEWLLRIQEWDIRIAVVIWIARFFVGVTRGVLWILMMLGHALSCFMLRQMEFDADRYETHLAGSDAFGETARRLPLLSVGVQFAQGDLEDSLHDQRLVDDFVALALENEANLPEPVRREVVKSVEEETTGLLETHPATSARIEAAQRLAAPGIFRYDGPATVLLQSFGATCRRATRDYYDAVIGPEMSEVTLVPFAEYIVARNAVQGEIRAVRRYFQDTVNALRPLPLPADVQPEAADPAALEATIRDAREHLLADLEAHRSRFERLDALDTRRLELRHAQALLDAEMNIDASDFQLTSGSLYDLRSAQAEVAHEVDDVLGLLVPLERLGGQRFWAALTLARAGVGVDPEVARARRETIDRLLPTLVSMTPLIPSLVVLRDEAHALVTLLEQLEENQSYEPLHAAVYREAHQLQAHVHAFGGQLGEAVNPLEPGAAPPPLWQHLLGEVEDSDDEIERALVPANNAVDRSHRFYLRVLGRLVAVAEQVEDELDLPPLPDLPDFELSDDE